MHQRAIIYAANNISHDSKTSKSRQIFGAELLKKESDSTIHHALHFSIIIIRSKDCNKSHVVCIFDLAQAPKDARE